MAERRINWGADGTDAKYRTEDAGDPGNFVVVEDLDGNTVLLQWNDTASQWEYAGNVDLGGNNLSSVNVQSFDDAAADPSANGELQRNGTDLKAFSGGAVRNLSDIGGGSLAQSRRYGLLGGA